MSAWHKQAIPLRFVEVFAEAIDKHCAGTRLKVVRKRIDKWVAVCWEFIPGGRRERDRSVQKKTAKIFNNLKEYVHNEWWPEEEIAYPPAICTAMLAVVDDAYFAMPSNNPERKHAWKWLRRALFDLTELTDPELEDREAHHWGCRLADKVKEEIEQ